MTILYYSQEGPVGVYVLDPLGSLHNIEEIGSDGLVLTGNKQDNYTSKAISWDELDEQNFTVYVGHDDVSLTIRELSQTVPQFKQDDDDN